MKIDLGEIIRKRIIIFPALDKEPKKEPPSWGLFPEFTLTDEQLAENLEYRYPASLVSGSPAELSAMTDRAIEAGNEVIDAGNWELWRYAMSLGPVMRVRGKPLFEVRIIFVFRARRAIPFAPAETPSGSIIEIPKEPTPEDLEKKPKEEVKNG